METTNIINSMLTELRRGTLTLVILSQLKESKYGYSLLSRLEEKHTGIEAGTLYPLLRRLESQGILEGRWDTGENRPRKYYKLSEYGLEVYNLLKSEWERLSQTTDALLKEES